MKNIVLFLGFLVATGLGIEAFLKLTRITPPTLKHYDPVYGSLNRPNIQYFKAVEGMYVGSTNYDGRFRENYPKRKADKSVLRIALVGDSFVEGIDVFSHNHFARYMEDILGSKLHRKVEVLDFGRGNCYISASSYYFVNYIEREYDADLVLYFTEGRDIFQPNDKEFFPSTSYALDSNQKLVASYNWKKTPEYQIHKKLSMYPVLKDYDNYAYFRLLYRAVARVKISGMPLMTFGKFGLVTFDTIPGIPLIKIPKFVGKPLTQDYTTYEIDDSVCALTQHIYDTLNKFDKGQMIYVVRNKPIYTPAILAMMKKRGYNYINLTDTFTDFNIKNTNVNAYRFKASGAEGGHWNNEGHAAVGQFLSNRILRDLHEYKTPNYEK